MIATTQPARVLKLRLRDLGEPIIYTLPPGATALAGDILIIETEDGLTYASASANAYLQPAQLACCQRSQGNVLRVATANDAVQVDTLRRREAEAKEFCQDRAMALGLEMRITDVQGNLSGNNLTCHFVSDRRVDFRQLVRDVGGRFRCHVLMRQVPPREEAKRQCGIGPCGRTLCCSSFMEKPRGVTSQEARKSAPGVSPAKLTGACGKLMCCLGYDAKPKPKLVQGP